MLEKIRGIQNPLTIIAIFAGLAEIAGTVALTEVSKEIQPIFIWFVMGFPTVLVLAFFVTLNFNPKVLYAPSDFRTDDSFLVTLLGNRAMNENFRGLSDQLEKTSKSILDEALKEIGEANSVERARLTSIIDDQMRLLRQRVEVTRESAVETALATAQVGEVVRCDLCKLVQFRSDNSICRKCGRPLEGQRKAKLDSVEQYILSYFDEDPYPVRVDDIADSLGETSESAMKYVNRLSARGVVVLSKDEDGFLTVAPSKPRHSRTAE